MATCNDSTCPMHGVCHCGCGVKTWIATQSQAKYSHVRGMPAEYRSGHVAHGVGRANERRMELIESGGWTGTVRVGPLLPDIELLVQTYTQKGLARRLGVTATTVARWQHGAKHNYRGQRRGLLIRAATARRLERLADDLIFGVGSHKPEQLSFPELEHFMARRGTQPVMLGEHDARLFYRYRVAGEAPLLWADRICVEVLGVHPIEVWGMETYLGEAA